MGEISLGVMIHAGLGELGAICFIWVLIEIINQKDEGLLRARKASLIGIVATLASWFVGGYYYVVTYGSQVKPIIKASQYKWAHSIVMEVKEHVFLFIPILACTVWLLLNSSDSWKAMGDKGRKSVAVLATIIFLIGFSMAFLGFLISAGARGALALSVVAP